jgi:hypothetical protein
MNGNPNNMGNPNMNMGMSIDESMNGMQGGPGMY